MELQVQMVLKSDRILITSPSSCTFLSVNPTVLNSFKTKFRLGSQYHIIEKTKISFKIFQVWK